MTSRREFLQIGITATAWPLAANVAGAAAAGDTLPLYKVVYDRRAPATAPFAERGRALGLALHAIDGDMTKLWYEDLYHVWKQGPIAIAGFTGHGALFCLDQLGRDQGLRVVFRAEHALRNGGLVEHDLSGPISMLRDATALSDAGDRWGARMADVVARCPRGRTEVATTAAATRACTHAAAEDSLYSWVIAPAVKA
jgi:hypothetical protein